jgi:hypothetical protein
MNVIGHQHIGMNRTACFLSIFSQPLQVSTEGANRGQIGTVVIYSHLHAIVALPVHDLAHHGSRAKDHRQYDLEIARNWLAEVFLPSDPMQY